MKSVLIVSLKFHPGHVSHMIASYRQCEELGYTPSFYVDVAFIGSLPKACRTLIYGKDDPSKIDIALFLFPCTKNINAMWSLKSKCGSKIIYVFHEPVEKYSRYLEVGYSKKYVVKKMLANVLYKIMVRISNSIILPSEKSLRMYDENKGYKNKNRYYLPLMFDDETIGTDLLKSERIYFSYIGTIAIDHSYTECLEFMLWAIENNKLPNLKFLIATKNNVERTERVQKAVEGGRLVIVDGRPMTNEEINSHYASSYAIWNAYARTNQSGVLPKAFMCGASALVLKENMSEFVEDGKNVISLQTNKDCQGIADGIERLLNNFDSYSKNCRDTFMNKFYYRNNNETFKKIVES